MAKSTKKASENHPENVKKTAPKNITKTIKKTSKIIKKHQKTRPKKETPKGLPGLATYGATAFDGDPLLPQTPSSQRCLTAPERKGAQALSVTYYLLLTTSLPE